MSSPDFISKQMPYPDIFTGCYKAIRDVLLRFEPFVQAVKPMNFPDLSASNFEYVKPEVSANDLPELILAQSAFEILPWGRNSKCLSFKQVYPIIITIDRLGISAMNRLKLITAVALRRGGENLGYQPVRDFNIKQGNDDMFGQPQWTRDKARWMSVMNIVVDLDLSDTFVMAG